MLAAVTEPRLAILHLCDSLFPLGAFAYSDGLEAAVALTAPFEPARGPDAAIAFLLGWLDATIEESIGRTDGPAIWAAWRAVHEDDWPTIAALGEEVTALRPSLAARRSSRALGLRLLTTWSALHPEARLTRALADARAGQLAAALPVAFAIVCASAGIGRRESLEAFAYVRLAAATSAAMRLLPIGQTSAHRLLAQALDRVPAAADAIARRNGPPESFAPMLDIAAMSQQYLHSRLFRS
jgi:urease accessory protein